MLELLPDRFGPVWAVGAIAVREWTIPNTPVNMFPTVCAVVVRHEPFFVWAISNTGACLYRLEVASISPRRARFRAIVTAPLSVVRYDQAATTRAVQISQKLIIAPCPVGILPLPLNL